MRDVFGLNPLLVNFVSSDVTELGRANAENLVNCDFTLLSVQPNPQIAQKLAKKSFAKHGNIAKFSNSPFSRIRFAQQSNMTFLWCSSEKIRP